MFLVKCSSLNLQVSLKAQYTSYFLFGRNVENIQMHFRSLSIFPCLYISLFLTLYHLKYIQNMKIYIYVILLQKNSMFNVHTQFKNYKSLVFSNTNYILNTKYYICMNTLMFARLLLYMYVYYVRDVLLRYVRRVEI